MVKQAACEVNKSYSMFVSEVSEGEIICTKDISQDLSTKDAAFALMAYRIQDISTGC